MFLSWFRTTQLLLKNQRSKFIFNLFLLQAITLSIIKQFNLALCLAISETNNSGVYNISVVIFKIIYLYI